MIRALSGFNEAPIRESGKLESGREPISDGHTLQ